MPRSLASPIFQLESFSEDFESIGVSRSVAKVLGINGPWISIWLWFEGGKRLNKPSECEQLVDVRVVMPSTVVVNEECAFVI